MGEPQRSWCEGRHCRERGPSIDMWVGTVGIWVGMMVCGVSNWGHSHLNRFWDLMNRGGGLLGGKATSSNRLEFSIKSSLCFSNLQNVIKIGISNLSSHTGKDQGVHDERF